MICQLCQSEFKSLTALHTHLTKIHKQTQGEYYHFFHPRYDLYDGERLLYKTYKDYFKKDFNLKGNLLKWAAEGCEKEEVKNYCLDLFIDRAREKGLVKFPSQVEFKSLFLPSLIGYAKLFGSVETFAMKTGLRNDFSYVVPAARGGEIEIWQDTREQCPLPFDIKPRVVKLSAGDYGTTGEFYSDVFIERKSLMDLAGTLSAGVVRFEKELERAVDLGFYIVVMVECPFVEALEYSPSNSFAKKMTGAHLFHEIRRLMIKFDNLQFFFSGNRISAAKYTELFFRMGGAVKTTDLQYLKDKGEI